MKTLTFILLAFGMLACRQPETNQSTFMKKVDQFAPFTLTADLSHLNDDQKEMLKLFFKAADIMDELFWEQAYGDKHKLLDTIDDPQLKRFVEINYGPWERLNGNEPFVDNAGKKPAGANFYPVDMTSEEFSAWENELKNSQYSVIRRDSAGRLVAVPYHEAYREKIKKASALLKTASDLAENEGFRKYLELRSSALLSDNYRESDMAWMDMKDNAIDFVIGPIENYEDQLYGIKTAFEAYILIKDLDWSQKLVRFAALLPDLQKKLPVEEKYKTETPGTSSDLAVYDVIYYAGDCNAGSKTIAINLPNDEEVQLRKGSRRLQLKNAMQAKFDKILVPIADELIVPEQQDHISFEAFFANTMFHEVAHGLGIKNTLDGSGTVREALKEQYSALEEGKADILGLFLVTQLKEMGELDIDLMDSYTTFLAGIFRSIRFGSSSAHGKANLVRFNYFQQKGAFTVNEDGRYAVNFEKMEQAVNDLSREILVIQGDGNYEGAKAMTGKYGILTDQLQESLDRINSKGIPVDAVFDQGPRNVGL